MGYYANMSGRPASVIELAGYRRRAAELLTEEEQNAIVDLVAYEPACGDVIPGACGLLKVRVGLSGRGKRGGARIVYFFHDSDMPIFLLAVYAKNERSDLTAADKQDFANLARELVQQWRRR